MPTTDASEKAKAELRQRLVAEVSSDLVYEWDVVEDTLEWFGDVDAALGFSADEIPRTIEGWVSRIHPDDLAQMADAVEHHRKSTEPIFYVYRIQAKDGSWRWWEDRGTPVLDDTGRPTRWVGACTDITDRKEAEEELRESEERLELILQASELATWTWDLQTDEAVINERWAEMLGCTLEELEPHNTLLNRLVHPEDNQRVEEALEAHLEGRTPMHQVEYRMQSKSGDWVWCMGSGKVLSRAEDGKPLRAAGVVLDITPRIRAEEEKARLQAQLLQAQKMESLGVLAGGIAHDFNNMLTGMLGGAELALMDIGDEASVREHLEHVRTTAQQAADLCRQLLAYSGKGRFVVEPIDMTSVVEEMTHLLEVSVSKKAVLRFDLARDLPRVEADVSQLRQIVLNLVINASEALEKRSGTILIATGAMDCDEKYLSETWLDENLPSGCYTFLEVSDTGLGMDQETKTRVFDPFFSTKFAGRGLGLAATLGIVRGHHGAIKVYSEEGRGTTFKVLLPALDVTAADVAAKGAAPAVQWRGSGRILLVDDEETVRAVGKRMLERLGLSVLIAEDGRRALEIYREHAESIDLVLLDMTMPHLDGEETFREIRRIRKDVSVILISGYNEQDAVSRFAGKGLAGFLQKPLSLDTLREKLRELMTPDDE